MLPENVFQRLFRKDTVNSIARRVCSADFPDSLDLVLSSVYNHEKNLFPNKCDTILQIDNAKHNPIKEKLYEEMILKEKNDIHHPLVIGKFFFRNAIKVLTFISFLFKVESRKRNLLIL